jgi:hypothetical protein
MIALFAVGVVTGTILSFELGLLWPNFMATFGDVFGLAFGLEGFSFFVEAIFIAIYVYGWDRMPPRLHLLCGVPVVVAGLTGSLFVISVNAWMNNPSGFRLEGGRAVDVEPWEALRAFRVRALAMGLAAGALAVGGLIVLREDRDDRWLASPPGAAPTGSFAEAAGPVTRRVGMAQKRGASADSKDSLASPDASGGARSGRLPSIGLAVPPRHHLRRRRRSTPS